MGAAALFLVTNFSVLKSGAVSGMREISGDEASIVVSPDLSTDILFDEPEGVFINKLLFDLDAAPSAPHTVCVCVLTDTGTALIEDLNPAYLTSEVLNIGISGIKSIHIETDVPAVNFRIDNSLNKNVGALIFGALFGVCLAGLLILLMTGHFEAENVFLLIALTMGLSMVVSLPATKVGYDEEAHLREVYAIAMLPRSDLAMSPGTLYELTVTDFNDPSALPSSAEETEALEKAIDLNCNYEEGESTPDFAISLSRVPAYLTMALGAKAAFMLKLPFSKVVRMVRLFNLMTFIALMYLAVRFTPRFKILMASIGLLPQCLFMAACCSYDPFVIGTLSLAFALMLKGSKYLIPAVICAALGCMVKAVYAPMILLGLPLLGKDQKKSRHLVLKALTLLIFIILIAVFILPTVINPLESGDLRGGNVSELTQVNFILSSPLKYLAVLAPQMLSWAGKCFLGPDVLTFMGHLVNGESSFMGYWPFYIALIIALIALSYPGASLRENFKDLSFRVWILVLVILTSALIWTAMFVAFTEPGASGISGVQGRYFIPLLFPLYYAISGRGSRLEQPDSLCYDLWGLAELIALALLIYRVCIKVFCV